MATSIRRKCEWSDLRLTEKHTMSILQGLGVDYMNNKQRMLAVIKGEPVDRIPYAPRLDLWYRANKLGGTLPKKYKNASLIEMVDDLDMGFHAVVPNFRDLRDPLDDAERALGYIFENMRVAENYDGYQEFAEEVGDRGLAAAFVSLAGSPMHLIQRELMPMDLFFYEMHDHADKLRLLAEQIELYWDRQLEILSNCPAEAVLVGANYDASVTYPPFFEQYIGPWLRKYARGLHGKGKYLLTHTDGENTGLLEHYLEAEIDIADSICPEPMTRLTFKQVRDVFQGKITIMGGIPSVTLLKLSMHDDEFERFLDEFFEMIGKGDHLILGISDTTPPAAEFDRLLKIKHRIEGFQQEGV